MGFETQAAVKQVPYMRHGRQCFELLQPLVFHCGWDTTDGIRVEVPVGFTTDFASTPRILWPLFPPAGPWSAAAIMHDYLYTLPDCSRFLADALFRDAMAHLGVPLWRRVVMYYAVRLCGMFNYGGST
jgi:hypothetical protein